MAVIAIQKTTLTGVNPTMAAASAGGDKFQNDGTVIFHIKNASAVPITATFVAPATCSHGFNHNAVATVAAGATVQVGPFDARRFNGTDGQVSVTYSAVATVTVAAVSARL